jgi:predicted metalloprotease with PDZ domain
LPDPPWVDATDLQHRIFRVRERIPVEAGPFTLWLPKWLPGNHGPTGHPASIAGLTIQAHGKRLEFKRDPVDVYAFHIQVPKGASELEVRFETITPSNPGAGRTVVTPTMVNLEWIATALYPAGYDIAEIRFKASLTLPPQWKAFSALDVESETNGVVRYKETDFDTLTDSPVFAGKHYKTYDLDPGAKIPVRLNVISDDPLFIAPKEEHMAAHRNLVQQAYKLYNSQHYDRYDFLLALSIRARPRAPPI